MNVSVRQLTMWVGLFGLATLFLFVVGLDTPAQLFALVQLAAFVGAPLAAVLHRELRSRAVIIVIGIALSISLSSLAVQSLIWFNLASRELLVVVATAYGMVLAWLLDAAEFGPPVETSDGRGEGAP